MNNWRDKLYRFMQGRYGRIDELGRFLMYLLFGLLLVSLLCEKFDLFPADSARIDL